MWTCDLFNTIYGKNYPHWITLVFMIIINWSLLQELVLDFQLFFFSLYVHPVHIILITIILWEFLQFEYVRPPIINFFKIVFTISVPLQFHINFCIFLSTTAKCLLENKNLLDIALNTNIYLGGNTIIIILTLPVPNHEVYLYSFKYCLISVSSVLHFPV